MLERVWRKGNPPTLLLGIDTATKEYGGSLKKLKTELPYGPSIPLLGIYPKKTILQTDTRTPMCIAALYTIVRTCKQTECPSTGEWIKKM